MIIKSIHLKNIRSYVDEKIEFDRGIILFEGDIGSGKTSILMAIDFALFGNSTRDFYERLLRKGANRGSVEILFEHNGREYRVFRALEKKGRGISNTESYVETEEGKIQLGASEIRHYILNLLGVNVEGRRRKSLPIVKYAIYTPQETMKEILEGNSEERMEVIRKIFKLDEYKIARENAKNVASGILAEARIAKDLEEMIEELENEIGEREKERKELLDAISALENKLIEKGKEMEEIEGKWNDIKRKREKYEELRNKLREINGRRRGKEEYVDRIKREIEEIEGKKKRVEEIKSQALRYEELERRRDELGKRIDELNRMEREIRASQERLKYLLEKVKKGEEKKKEIEKIRRKIGALEEEVKRKKEIEEELEKLREKDSELRGKIGHLNFRLNELERERQDYEHLGAVCPKCKRPLTEEHKRKLIEENASEIERTREEIRKISREKVEIEKRIKSLEDALNKIMEASKALAILRRDMENAKRDMEEGENARKESEVIRKKIENFDFDSLKRVREEMNNVEKEMRDLKRVWMEYNTLKKEVEKEARLRAELREATDILRKLMGEEKKYEDELKGLGYSSEEYERINEEYLEISKTLRSLETELREKKRREEEIGMEIEKKRRDVKEKREKLNFYRKMEEFGRWIREELIPALEDIEEMRMIAINEEFRALFEEWFHELLGESEYEATVDEKFTPIIRYQRFDMPLGTLSGGERTSVALAYRLALNTMVKRALGLSSNLLILDEPTDGFSKDQLYKLKDVFERMETDQIIIVSHEKELMNLADKVYHVEKFNGVSKIRII